MNPVIRHEMILASAGSGKTYALVNRYIRLLALEVPPGRIMAITFTRKAAGEFMQKIFLRLCQAGRLPAEAECLSRECGLEPRDCAFFRGLLSTLVRALGDLQLGTIDSFFARVVGAFPYELGLTRPHRIMDDFEHALSRDKAMERLFAHGDPAQAEAIQQLYKEMTWGAEEKRVYGQFEKQLEVCHSLYLESPDTDLWGVAARIFATEPWWQQAPSDPAALVGAICQELEASAFPASVLKAMKGQLEAFTDWQPGLPLKTNTLFQRVLDQHAELAGGQATIKVGRGAVDLSGVMARLWFGLAQAYVRGDIARRLVTTHALGRLIESFDHHYNQIIREAGSLVFADLPMLLVKGLCGGQAAFAAEEMIYRMDGQTDHWLVDEFQDTSRIQWDVLAAFVDEILQDTSGRRSFFYVGDIKQSIYRWRGGDSRLFHEIFERYRGSGRLASSSLSQSWRSAPPVLDCVNAVFGRDLSAVGLAREAAARWHQHWEDHVCSPRTAGLAGHAAIGVLPPEMSLEEGCATWIRTLDPLRHGLSCAILMRTNKDVARMTQRLRQAGISASMEGEVDLAADNLLGTWMRACFTALARPDEAFPRAYLQWAGAPFTRESVNQLMERLRVALTEIGYAEAVRLVSEYVLARLPQSAFLKHRAEQLLEAALRFETAGPRPLEAFIRYLESAKVQESGISHEIQVMTVHKAKGLDFDVVLVAGFGAQALVRPGNRGPHVERDPSGEVEWILDLPNKAVLEADPVLFGAAQREKALDTFESLCVLYVAMTRARRGLYCLAESPARNSSEPTWLSLLTINAGEAVEPVADGLPSWQSEWGDADWIREAVDHEPESASPALRLDRLQGDYPRPRPALRRRPSPSQEGHAREPDNRPLRSTKGRQLGTRMHEFLATLGWIDPADGPAMAALRQSVAPDLWERLVRLLETPLGRQVFTQPAEPGSLWQEKPYILRQGKTAASGIIDRAFIYGQPGSRPTRAVIYDFKTDVLDPRQDPHAQLLERYGTQLDRYREAMEVLTGLSPEAITAHLVPV